MSSPVVSVVMPIRNAARTLERAMAGLYGQTLKDWELIAVDDASTDGTPEMLEAHRRSDARIRVLRNDRNLGIGGSLDRGCRSSRGAFIARMDADDWSCPRRLERQVEYLGAHPEIAVLGTAMDLVDRNYRLLGRVTRPEEWKEIQRCALRGVAVFHPTVMFRKEFYDASGGYKTSLRWAQDLELWIRTVDHWQFHNLPEALTTYTFKAAPNWAQTFAACRILWEANLRQGRPLSGAWIAARRFVASASLGIGLQLGGLRRKAGGPPGGED